MTNNIEYVPIITKKKLVYGITLATILFVYLLFYINIFIALFLFLFTVSYFITRHHYSNLLFEQNQIIYKKKKLKILSYLESEDFISGSKWGRIGLFADLQRKSKMLRISTPYNTFYIYEDSCYNYMLIKRYLIENKIDFNQQEYNNRSNEINKLNKFHSYILGAIIIAFFIGLILFLINYFK